MTSNVKQIPGFGISQSDQLYVENNGHSMEKKYSTNPKDYQYETYDFNNDKISEQDSKNTFINKFDDVKSASDLGFE